MTTKIIKFFLPISLLFMSCASNQATDIKDSVIYNLDNYQIVIRAPKGLCINNDLINEKEKVLSLILTECIKIANSNKLFRRPISSIITVKFQKQKGLNKFSKISDFIGSTGKDLNYILGNNGQKINNSYQKGNTLFISMSKNNNNNILNTGNKFWKTFSLYDNILISTSAYGFSKKNNNRSSFKELEDKLQSIVNSIIIKKINNDLSV